MSKAFIIIVFFTVTCAMCLQNPVVSAAHPFHATIGEAHMNQEDRALEISLRMRVVDLTNVLPHVNGVAGDNFTLLDMDKELFTYLRKNFSIRRAGGENLSLKWLGCEYAPESAKTHLWLHFWVAPLKDADELIITNRVLFDLHPDQTNTLLVKNGDQRLILTFHRDEPSRRLEIYRRHILSNAGKIMQTNHKSY